MEAHHHDAASAAGLAAPSDGFHRRAASLGAVDPGGAAVAAQTDECPGANRGIQGITNHETERCNSATTSRTRKRLTLDEARERMRFCDSYSRLRTLFELWFITARDDWHTLVGEEWSGCDNIGRWRQVLRAMLPKTGPVPQMMDAAEMAAFEALPDRITVYRGCGKKNMLGASWSLSRDVATKFPFLSRYRQAEPLLVTATVRRSAVLALKLDRDEFEVITFGARRIAVEALDRGVH